MREWKCRRITTRSPSSPIPIITAMSTCRYIKQDEPLKLECQHFLDCIRGASAPITGGREGLQVVHILEAAGHSLRQQGRAVAVGKPVAHSNGHAFRVKNGSSVISNGVNGNRSGHNGVALPVVSGKDGARGRSLFVTVVFRK